MIEGLVSPRGRLVVISGPSGVGKGTVISSLLNSPSRPDGVVLCTTATTRSPRAGEVNGRDYFFFTREQFEERIARGFFLEHVTYNDCYYGTPREQADHERSVGHDVALEIEVRGGLTLKERESDTVLIFLAPPSWEELERRLRSRQTDSPEHVARRLEIARQEMLAAPRYDYVVTNDTPEHAADLIRAIILAERHRVRTGGSR